MSIRNFTINDIIDKIASNDNEKKSLLHALQNKPLVGSTDIITTELKNDIIAILQNPTKKKQKESIIDKRDNRISTNSVDGLVYRIFSILSAIKWYHTNTIKIETYNIILEQKK